MSLYVSMTFIDLVSIIISHILYFSNYLQYHDFVQMSNENWFSPNVCNNIIYKINHVLYYWTTSTFLVFMKKCLTKYNLKLSYVAVVNIKRSFLSWRPAKSLQLQIPGGSGGHIFSQGGSRNLCSNYLEDRFRMWRTQKPPHPLFGRDPAVWELSGECSHRLGPRARPATHTNPFRLLSWSAFGRR